MKAGFLLLSRDTGDTRLWFVFHHDADGALAIDLTTAHPDIGYEGFAAVLDFEDTKPASERIVLLGGPEQDADALLILHETGANSAESHVISPEFSFLSYRYVRLPGKPPALMGNGPEPSRIRLKNESAFLVALGFRAWEAGTLEREVREGQWTCLPASPDSVFGVLRTERHARVHAMIN